MIAEVREAIRLDGLYARLRRERANDPLGTGIALLSKAAFWLGAPALALLAAETWLGRRWHFLGTIFGLALGWTLCHWVGASAARTDAFQSLRMPSRSARRAARWLLRLPWFLYCGALWSVAARLWMSGEARISATAFALCLPLLQGAVSGWNRAVRARFPCSAASWTGYLLAGLLVPVSVALFAILPSTRIPLATAAPLLAAVLLVGQIRLARTGEVALHDDWGGEENPRMVRAFDLDLPTHHAGATGIAGAARARKRAEDRIRGGLWFFRDLPVRGLAILFGEFPAPLAAAIYLLTQGERTAPSIFGLTVVVLLVAPVRGTVHPDLRVWLYGAQVRELHRARLRSFLTHVALPTLGVSLAGVLYSGPTPILLAFLAAILAAVILRAGAGGLWSLGATRLWRPVASLAILAPLAAAVATGSPAAWWSLIGVAALLGGIGLRKLLRAPEEVLLDLLRDSAFPPASE